MKRKEHPGVVYSVAREAAEAYATDEHANKLHCVQSRPKDAVARVGSAKKEKEDGVGRGGQGSSAHSGDFARQLLELRTEGSQNGRLHDEA